jgi:hypothetical protein
MAPVISDGIDAPVGELGQWIATVLTFGLAFAVLVWILVTCRRERIVWPLVVAVSGTLTCLMEPLFDHLYGLWFLEEGQWHLYTTFGSAQPIWVPAAYLTFYGGATVFIARFIERRPTMRTVWTMYAFIVVMAIAAEMTYVSVLVSGMIVYRVAPLLRGAGNLYLIPIVPMAFAAGLFGSGILYLSVRHSVENPPMVLVHIAALTVVAGIASTVGLLGKLLVVGKSASAQQLGPREFV